ncbi:unnamed protein product [Knipowitschia caucasica]|uniref:Pro-adrenomedullin n=1 Tax=Knipowitschia caucasica TaxID=637954 RepID=A0AAV2IZH8_KNICA
MRPILPGALLLLTACCIIQAERAEEDWITQENRLDIINQFLVVPEDSHPPPPYAADSGLVGKWLRPLLQQLEGGPRLRQPEGPSHLRPRRHLSSRGSRGSWGSRGSHHQGQLMRVGCKLGTCQVQNLSHRLYQLIGQSGREDSSPINPKSPHSYG